MRSWVDTYVWRISIRLGLIGKKVTADAAHDLLQALLPQDARTIYNFHKGLLRHGQRICVFERPRCNKCPITDQCDYYQTVVKSPKITCFSFCLLLILNTWISCTLCACLLSQPHILEPKDTCAWLGISTDVFFKLIFYTLLVLV
jgi:hypothetical protein